jgi:hypothetical protein
MLVLLLVVVVTLLLAASPCLTLGSSFRHDFSEL